MQRLDIGGYTRQQVIDALHHPMRREAFRFELLDKHNQTKVRALRGVMEASVENNSLAQIKRTATFLLQDGLNDIDYLSDRIRPWVQIQMPPPTGTFAGLEREDWSSYPVGAPPPGWTERWAPGGTWEVRVIDDPGQVGNKVLRLSHATGGRRVLTWDAIGSTADATIVARVRSSAVTGDQAAVRVRVSGGAGTETGYWLAMEGGDAVSMRRYVDGAPALLASAPYQWDADRWYWLRLEVQGHALRGKVWADGEGEPVDWTLTATDGNISSGYVGVGKFAAGGYVDFCTVGAAAKARPAEGLPPQWLEWPQGVFLLSSPLRQSDIAGGSIRQIQAYDQLVILRDDRVLDRYTITAGTRYIDAVEELLTSAGIRDMELTPRDSVLPADRDWAPGTSRLEIINDLLNAINYRSMTFDAMGRAIARPYVPPSEQEPEYAYIADADSVIAPEAVEEFDLYDVANRWVLVVSEPDREPLTATYTNQDPASPTSTVRRGRVIVDYREYEEAADAETLQARAERIAYEASQVYQAIVWESAIMPHHADSDVYRLAIPALDVDATYSEHSWEMEMRPGGTMRHRSRRVVSV